MKVSAEKETKIGARKWAWLETNTQIASEQMNIKDFGRDAMLYVVTELPMLVNKAKSNHSKND